jgi:hypothetical protein
MLTTHESFNSHITSSGSYPCLPPVTESLLPAPKTVVHLLPHLTLIIHSSGTVDYFFAGSLLEIILWTNIKGK